MPLPQLGLSIAFSFGIPMAFAAIRNELPWECWALFAANVCYAFAYDTEYAMVDRDDDLKIGIRTSAITLGRYDVAAVMASYVADGRAARLDRRRAGAWLAVSRRACDRGRHDGSTITRLIRGRSREGCFRAFRHNNWVGLAIFAGIVALLHLPVIRGDLLAEFEFDSGAQRGSRLTLYANRLVLHGGDAMETVPLAQLASVRVAFERDPRKLNWAIGLLVLALILAAASGPLQALATALAAGVKEHGAAANRSMPCCCRRCPRCGGLARLLAPLAAALRRSPSRCWYSSGSGTPR